MDHRSTGQEWADKDSSQPLLPEGAPPRIKSTTRYEYVSKFVWGSLIVSWLIISVLAASVLRLSAGRLDICNRRHGDQGGYWSEYEHVGIQRELAPAYKHVQFTGALRIVPGQGLVREVDQSAIQYVGPPTNAIDRAWQNLIHPVNLFLTKDEAAVMGTEGMGIEPESDLYMVMPQGFHNLHCLDMLRRSLYPQHYNRHETNETVYIMHLEHCIDALRQQVQCNADMTINKEHWDEHKGTSGGMMADFNNWHVCRDWDAIREWSTRRNAQDEDAWRPIAQRLKLTGA